MSRGRLLHRLGLATMLSSSSTLAYRASKKSTQQENEENEIPRLINSGGKHHFSLPKSSKYDVGSVDLASAKCGFVRLFYPCHLSEKREESMYPDWFPENEYVRAYVKLRWPHLPVPATLVKWSVSYPSVPVIWNAKPLKAPDGKWPLVLFTHGLASCRTSYSWLCLYLASMGFVVAATEHRDGSASLARMVEDEGKLGFVSWHAMPMGDEEGEGRIRERQIRARTQECFDVLDMLSNIENNVRDEDDDILVNPVNMCHVLKNLDLNELVDLWDTKQVLLAGHSFGSTTILSMMEHRPQLMRAVCIDSVLSPISEHVFTVMADAVNSVEERQILFINYGKFQKHLPESNLERMRALEQTDESKEPNCSNVLTLKYANHYDASDLPLLLDNTRLGHLLNRIWRKHRKSDKNEVNEGNGGMIASKEALLLTAKLAAAFLIDERQGGQRLQGEIEQNRASLQVGTKPEENN